MPDGVNFTHVYQFIMLLVAGISALFTVWWRIELRIREVENKAKHDVRNVEMIAADKRSAIDKDLQSFKLHVAQEYASWDAVRQIEQRLGNRMETISEQVRTMPDLVVERITQYLTIQSVKNG